MCMGGGEMQSESGAATVYVVRMVIVYVCSGGVMAPLPG